MGGLKGPTESRVFRNVQDMQIFRVLWFRTVIREALPVIVSIKRQRGRFGGKLLKPPLPCTRLGNFSCFSLKAESDTCQQLYQLGGKGVVLRKTVKTPFAVHAVLKVKSPYLYLVTLSDILF